MSAKITDSLGTNQHEGSPVLMYKIVPVYAMEVYRGSRRVAPHIRNLNTITVAYPLDGGRQLMCSLVRPSKNMYFITFSSTVSCHGMYGQMWLCGSSYSTENTLRPH
jgi:hypothetical protein